MKTRRVELIIDLKRVLRNTEGVTVWSIIPMGFTTVKTIFYINIMPSALRAKDVHTVALM